MSSKSSDQPTRHAQLGNVWSLSMTAFWSRKRGHKRPVSEERECASERQPQQTYQSITKGGTASNMCIRGETKDKRHSYRSLVRIVGETKEKTMMNMEDAHLRIRKMSTCLELPDAKKHVVLWSWIKSGIRHLPPIFRHNAQKQPRPLLNMAQPTQTRRKPIPSPPQAPSKHGQSHPNPAKNYQTLLNMVKPKPSPNPHQQAVKPTRTHHKPTPNPTNPPQTHRNPPKPRPKPSPNSRPAETHPKPTNPPLNMVKPTQAETHPNPFQALLNMVKPTQTQPKPTQTSPGQTHSNPPRTHPKPF